MQQLRRVQKAGQAGKEKAREANLAGFCLSGFDLAYGSRVKL
jgi:hypothetical protein